MNYPLQIVELLNRFLPNELIYKILFEYKGLQHPIALIINTRKLELDRYKLWLNEPIHMSNFWNLTRSFNILLNAKCYICKKSLDKHMYLDFLQKKNMMKTTYVEELKKIESDSFIGDNNIIIYYHYNCVIR